MPTTCGLEGAGAQDRLGLDFAFAGHHRRAVGLAPGEKRGVADQAGLGHLGIAGTQFAPRQSGQRRGVHQHHAGLVKGAEQVLAVARVDADLAADRGIDLRQQGRRHLHEGQAAQGGGGGEAGEVADRPPPSAITAVRRSTPPSSN